MSWRGLRLTAFERTEGVVLDLAAQAPDLGLVEAIQACYPTLGFAEMARLEAALAAVAPEVRAPLFTEYGLRWCDRLQSTFQALRLSPREFQDFVDDKKMNARDLSPLLALPQVEKVAPFLRALGLSSLSKSQGSSVLENGAELFLMGLDGILRTEHEDDASYCSRLEKARKPMTAARDDSWKHTVTAWPWPTQVQGHWQRFGDQSGLEIKIRATSPQDLNKKLERLNSIREKWSCST